MLNLAYEMINGTPRRKYGVTANGENVYSKPEGKECHVQSHPEVHPFYEDALKKVDASDVKIGETRAYTVDLGFVYATCGLVEVEENDPRVFYARRGTRAGRSRLITGVEMAPCTTMAIYLFRNPENLLIASTAYAGIPSALEPWDPAARGKEEECRNFWKIRALVVGERPQDAVPDDETYWIVQEKKQVT